MPIEATMRKQRKSATVKYLERVRQVLRNQLNGRNKPKAIIMYALPVIRYPPGIASGPQKEIDATNVKTFKVQHPENLRATERGWVRISECQSRNPG